MPLAYLDCFAGLSGDLFLGALVDLGYPLAELQAVAAAVVGDAARVEARREQRHGITGTRVLVIPAGADAASGGGADSNSHPHPHEPAHDHEHAGPHRHYGAIRASLEASDLPPRVRERAISVFDRLAEAEARIHDVEPAEVHFHEVGAVDSIVDVVGAVAGIEHLGLHPIVCAPVPVGSGTVRSQHGVIPVPAPATADLLRGCPVRPAPAPGEATTPTGAALAVALADRFGPVPSMVVEGIGYGVATRDPVEVANLLRIVVGREEASGPGRDRVEVLEAELDDMNPELYGHLADRLRDAGALDVTLTPVQMKKGRPGTSVRVLAPDGAGSALAATLLRESTTTGVRLGRVERWKLPREERTVETPWGAIRVKIVRRPGGRRLHPAYDDLARIASERDLPLVELERRVLAHLEAQLEPDAATGPGDG